MSRPQLADHPVPWIAAEAVVYLDQLLAGGSAHVLEFGAGNSTLWLAARCRRLVSVESSPVWTVRLQRRLTAGGVDNVVVLLVEPDDPVNFHPAYRGARDRSYRAYVEAGKAAVTAQLKGRLDVLLVDGRARFACIRDCAALVRPGGTLLLDNADRTRYRSALVLLTSAGWKRQAQFTASFGRAPVTDFWVCPAKQEESHRE